MDETYLGDAVYASFDGYCVWLKTHGGDNDQEIALEPSVFERLVSYVEEIHAKRREAEHVTD